MLKRIAIVVVTLGAVAAAALWAVAAPATLDDAALQNLGEADVGNGELVFWAGGCHSCHAAPESAGEAATVLAGGVALDTEFGTFHVPNISPHPEAGIGGWSFEDFANAMLRGVSPGGSHYYPAFPYGSYRHMDIEDVNDLWAYMLTLPASDNVAPEHEIGFPFNIRGAVGLWKYLYLDDAPHMPVDTGDPVLARGRYLVEGLGHCGECHTPRDEFGGFVENMWLAGAPNPEGDGNIPNITPGGSISGWSAEEIAYFLESGFTPDFDSVGGAMAAVQRDMAKLPAGDREAIAAYLKAIPERPNGYPAAEEAAEQPEEPAAGQ